MNLVGMTRCATFTRDLTDPFITITHKELQMMLSQITNLLWNNSGNIIAMNVELDQTRQLGQFRRNRTRQTILMQIQTLCMSLLYCTRAGKQANKWNM
jgi:hypothetical protein